MSDESIDKQPTAHKGRKHGHTIRGHYSPEYISWQSMISRCTLPHRKAYSSYGGRGITVCERWHKSFQDFLSDMGLKPSRKHTLDRYPNKNGNYEPGNVRWATAIEQGRNRRNNCMLTHNGETLCIPEWAERVGIPARVIHSRIFHRWTASDALTLPQGAKVTLTHDGETRSVAAWAKKTGLPRLTIYNRIKMGWSDADALTRPLFVEKTLTHNGETLLLTVWALKLGIKPNTLYARLASGWTDSKVLTTPTRKGG